jgi:hypothetical protein
MRGGVSSLLRQAASVASIGTLAVAAMPASAPACAVDPAFALIAARAAEVAHGEVIDAQDEAEAKYGIRSDEAWEAADRCGLRLASALKSAVCDDGRGKA